MKYLDKTVFLKIIFKTPLIYVWAEKEKLFGLKKNKPK